MTLTFTTPTATLVREGIDVSDEILVASGVLSVAAALALAASTAGDSPVDRFGGTTIAAAFEAELRRTGFQRAV